MDNRHLFLGSWSFIPTAQVVDEVFCVDSHFLISIVFGSPGTVVPAQERTNWKTPFLYRNSSHIIGRECTSKTKCSTFLANKLRFFDYLYPDNCPHDSLDEYLDALLRHRGLNVSKATLYVKDWLVPSGFKWKRICRSQAYAYFNCNHILNTAKESKWNLMKTEKAEKSKLNLVAGDKSVY